MSTGQKNGHQNYDPFGEPLANECSTAPSVLDRRANRAALTAFWALALLFVAGRVYTTDWPAAHAFVRTIVGGR